MTDKDARPREFWLRVSPQFYPAGKPFDVYEMTVAVTPPDFTNPVWNDFKNNYIHVIEKSAYDTLKAQAEKLAEALEKRIRYHDPDCTSRWEVRGDGKCDCSLKEAREALAEYRKAKT